MRMRTIQFVLATSDVSISKLRYQYQGGYDTIREAILKCAQKPTWVSLIYRTKTTTKKCQTEKRIWLDDFSSFLSFAATTPHEFIITGDFKIHLDNPADTLTSQFLSPLFFQS